MNEQTTSHISRSEFYAKSPIHISRRLHHPSSLCCNPLPKAWAVVCHTGVGERFPSGLTSRTAFEQTSAWVNLPNSLLSWNIRENTHLSRCVPGHTLFKWESTPHMKILQTNHFFEDIIVANLWPQMLRQRKNIHLQLVLLQAGESVFSIRSEYIDQLNKLHTYLKVVQLQRNNTMIYRVLLLLIWSNCNCWHAETASIM